MGASCTTLICSRGRSPKSRSPRAMTTSCAPPFGRRRRSGRSKTAAVRWSADKPSKGTAVCGSKRPGGGRSMFEIFGVPSQALFGQLLLGLINGSFYALLSLGLAVIFGMLNIINFAPGALYMMGAFPAYLLLQYLGIGYWWALVIAPIAIGALGVVIERLFLQHLRNLDHLYGLILTFGLALIIEGLFRNTYGSSGQPYAVPDSLQ